MKRMTFAGFGLAVTMMAGLMGTSALADPVCSTPVS